MKRLHRVLISLTAIVFFASTGLAHAIPPNADVWMGVSRLGANTINAGAGGQWGWQGALHVKIKPLLGVEGDVSQYGWGSNASVPHTTMALFGPRVTVGALGVKLFVHALGGVEHSAASDGSLSNTAAAYAGGGGIDLPLAPFFKWRVMADYVNAPTVSPAGSAHARYSTGLVFRF
jgi:hypothetical protein